MATKKELATTEQGELAMIEQVPDWMKTDGPARGSENVDMNDITLPRLSIIQDLSPQRKKNDAEYIQGAEEGMAFNTVTKELFDKPINLIFVAMIKEWVIWKDRKKGGGFFGAFPSEAQAVAALGELEGNANDYEVVDTQQHYCLLIKDGSTQSAPILEEAVISCQKSTMKMSRQLNTLAKLAGGDRFSRRYQLEVVQDENKAGEQYFNWKVTGKGFVSEPMYKAGEAMYEAVMSGERAVERSDETASKPTEKTVNVDDSIEDDF